MKLANTILIVEDDPHTVDLVKMYLSNDGYYVITAMDGNEGLRLAIDTAPDLILLDLMLPGMNGQDICERVRQTSDVPIIMLTAMVEEEDRLVGLDLGADDYITKPFSPREVVARVRAVLRRTARDAADADPENIEHDHITLRIGEKALSVNGENIHITPTEFRLLSLFMRSIGRVYSRDVIIEQVFGYDFDGFDRTVDAHISNLRGKVEPDPSKPRYIKTVYGMGYKFGNA